MIEALYALIRKYEGLYLKEYQCPAGVRTIGYGTTRFPADVHEITEEQAEEWMRREADKCLAEVLRICPNLQNEPEARQAACADFAFNLGLGAFASSTMAKRIKKSAWKDAAQECLKWCHVKGRVLPGLLRRRQEEARMLETGGV